MGLRRMNGNSLMLISVSFDDKNTLQMELLYLIAAVLLLTDAVRNYLRLDSRCRFLEEVMRFSPQSFYYRLTGSRY